MLILHSASSICEYFKAAFFVAGHCLLIYREYRALSIQATNTLSKVEVSLPEYASQVSRTTQEETGQLKGMLQGFMEDQARSMALLFAMTREGHATSHVDMLNLVRISTFANLVSN